MAYQRFVLVLLDHAVNGTEKSIKRGDRREGRTLGYSNQLGSQIGDRLVNRRERPRKRKEARGGPE